MKKNKVNITKTCILLVFLIISELMIFLPQDTIIGGKELRNDMLLKMFIAIILIFIYFIIRFHKKGFIKIFIEALFVPLIFEIVILFRENQFKNPISIILFVVAYAIYFIMYIKELEEN